MAQCRRCSREDLRSSLYLHSAGNANSRKGDGVLTWTAPDGDEPRDVFVYDPEVPVMAPGGPPALSGPFDQAALEMGNNLLVYTSQPVCARYGNFRAAPRHALCVDIRALRGLHRQDRARVAANGRAEFLSIGIARSSWLFRDASYLSG